MSMPSVLSAVDQVMSIPGSQVYWARYKDSPPTAFMFKISGSKIDDSAEIIGRNFGLIYHLGKIPPLIHGYGNSLSEELRREGFGEKDTDNDGERITTPEMMPIVRRVCTETRSRLVEAIMEYGGAKARPLPYGSVFDVEPKGTPDTGERNGKIVGVRLDEILDTIDQGYIPVISPVIRDQDGVDFNTNADVAGNNLAKPWEWEKFIWITGTNGFLNQDGKTISTINLTEQYADLAGKVITGEAQVKLDSILDLLRFKEQFHTPSSQISHRFGEHYVQIGTPENILVELFSPLGAGTMVSLNGLHTQ